jgi:hypothetical protein
MRTRSARTFVRVLLLAVAAVACATLLAPRGTATSPYVSALSNLAASPVYAKGCPDKICNRNVRCVPGIGYSCNRIGTSGCEATPCG